MTEDRLTRSVTTRFTLSFEDAGALAVGKLSAYSTLPAPERFDVFMGTEFQDVFDALIDSEEVVFEPEARELLKEAQELVAHPENCLRSPG